MNRANRFMVETTLFSTFAAAAPEGQLRVYSTFQREDKIGKASVAGITRVSFDHVAGLLRSAAVMAMQD